MNLGGPSETLLGKIAQGVDVQNVGLSYIAGKEKRLGNIDRILKSVLEISKHDAAGATKILAEEAKNYPELEKFQGIQFRDETKNNWITASINNGQTMMINIQTLGKIAKDPANKDKYLKEEAVTLGTPKMEPGKTREYQQGDQTITEEFDPKTGVWKKIGEGAKWNQNATKDDTLKEFRQHTAKLESLYRSKAGIQKGYDPITGSVIPQTQIDAALETINSAIADAEGYVQSVYPEQWKQYRKPAPTPGAGSEPLWNKENPPAIPFSGNAPQKQTGTQPVVPGVRGLVEQETQQAGQDIQLPIAALDALKKSNGQPVTFKNGQVWQFINGKAKRIR